MHVPSAFETRRIDQVGPQVRDRPRMGEDGPVGRASEHDAHPGRPVRIDDQPADIHIVAFELVAQEATERVVADHAAEPDAEPQTGRAGREDRSGTADGETRLVDEPLRLTERGVDVAGQHEVGVRVAQDEEIDRVGHARTIPEASTVANVGRRLGRRPGAAAMTMEGPEDAQDSRDLGAQRWGAEKEEIDKQARQEHLAHEAERIHAEEAAEMAAERGEAPKPKRPWWRFWG